MIECVYYYMSRHSLHVQVDSKLIGISINVLWHLVDVCELIGRKISILLKKKKACLGLARLLIQRVVTSQIPLLYGANVQGSLVELDGFG